jgi:DNA helicase HerA-like ATPase
LPDTAFSQAGTVIALRLTNGADQSRVRSGLPDSLLGLSDALPSLRTGEALVAGEAVAIPSRVLIDRPRPAPRADDASLAAWRSPAARNDIAGALARWRGLEVEAASNA